MCPVRPAIFGLLALLSSYPALAAPPSPWRITQTEWTEANETGFGDFVRGIAESGCTTTAECMRSSANPYRASDPPGLEFHMDCAKWAYTLRAYYAWKNGLPFSYVNAISGNGSDIRFSKQGNRVLSRRDLVDHGSGLPIAATFSDIRDNVYSATYRIDASQSIGLQPDFYSPKIQPGSIRAGTVLYDLNGHVAIVYAVEADGRVRYMGAEPDTTVLRSVYGPQIGQSQIALGGGFKNFRPLKLVGATLRNGSYIGGRIVLASDSEIADFSLEQYRGSLPDAQGDGQNAIFRYQDRTATLFEYVRGTMSGGTYSFDPVRELKLGLESLCHDLTERGRTVDAAIRAGIDKKPAPEVLPGNIYASEDKEWESFSSPSRDANLRSRFTQLTLDLANHIMRMQAEGRDYRDVWALKVKLNEAYRETTLACRITYQNSAGAPVSFGFDAAVDRLFAMSFDPYHCIERRWGATDAAELATCKDDERKTRWYVAEQSLRNQLERSYSGRSRLTLTDLETEGPGRSSGSPLVNIAAMIDKIGRGPLLAKMEPIGF
ncbi:MAG: hypothetical protein JF627_08620 [Alphaproteobacteria bacterium]|nr:hypothetical protein [Alphaproteobacteria bacterium]